MFIDFMKDTSLFGYKSDNPVDRAAYDMMVLDQIQRDEEDEKEED